MLDQLILARLQFASTTVFHFFFVPVTIGMTFLLAILETFYVRTGDEDYKKGVKFFSHLFLVNFAIGVVTGILQEFQFGMNWSEYSRFVGDVFGPSLAVEALLAFFLESTFIGFWVFGWDKLPKKLHCMSIWLVAIGTCLSAFWILTANSFMQHPVGFEIVDGRARMTDFWAIITNEYVWHQFPHVVASAWATGAFIIAGISAWKIYKNHEVRVFTKIFKPAIVVCLLSSLGVLAVGHTQAQYLIKEYPMKMAAAEAQWQDSGDSAPFTILATNIDQEKHVTEGELQVPGVLSFLAYDKFEGKVKGIETVAKEMEAKYGKQFNLTAEDFIPNVPLMFWSFRLMAGIGTAMFIASLLGTYFAFRNKVHQVKWFQLLMSATIVFPILANSFGWIMTEIGRQPFIIFGVMPTASGVSVSVSAESVLFSLITFCSLYGILGIIQIVLWTRMAKHDHTAIIPLELKEAK